MCVNRGGGGGGGASDPLQAKIDKASARVVTLQNRYDNKMAELEAHDAIPPYRGAVADGTVQHSFVAGWQQSSTGKRWMGKNDRLMRESIGLRNDLEYAKGTLDRLKRQKSAPPKAPLSTGSNAHYLIWNTPVTIVKVNKKSVRVKTSDGREITVDPKTLKW